MRPAKKCRKIYFLRGRLRLLRSASSKRGLEHVIVGQGCTFKLDSLYRRKKSLVPSAAVRQTTLLRLLHGQRRSDHIAQNDESPTACVGRKNTAPSSFRAHTLQAKSSYSWHNSDKVLRRVARAVCTVDARATRELRIQSVQAVTVKVNKPDLSCTA